MKRIYTIVFLSLITYSGFSQSLGFSTLGQLFNYAVGDSFEYEYSNTGNYNIQGSTGRYLCAGLGLMTINNIGNNGNTSLFHYTFISEDTGGIGVCSFGYGGPGYAPFPQWQRREEVYDSTYNTFVLYTPDSISVSMYRPCVASIVCLDTVYSNVDYNGHKQNRHTDYDFDETYADSIGLTNRGIYVEGGGYGYTLHLIWYHKTSGEEWGNQREIVLSSTNDLDQENSFAKVFPNPTTSNFNLELSQKPLEDIYLTLSDAQGRIVQKQQIFNRLTNIEVDKVEHGIYLWQVQGHNTTIGRGKLIIE